MDNRKLLFYGWCYFKYEGDEERAEEFKIISFISMVHGCDCLGIPYGGRHYSCVLVKINQGLCSFNCRALNVCLLPPWREFDFYLGCPSTPHLLHIRERNKSNPVTITSFSVTQESSGSLHLVDADEDYVLSAHRILSQSEKPVSWSFPQW